MHFSGDGVMGSIRLGGITFLFCWFKDISERVEDTRRSKN